VTYGVYSRDLHSCSANEMSLQDAKRWWREGRVVCSEKEIYFGAQLALTFLWNPKVWRLRWWYRWERKIYLGPIVIEYNRLHYRWADKVVYDGEDTKEGGEK